MKILLIPNGTPAVKSYRFMRAADHMDEDITVLDLDLGHFVAKREAEADSKIMLDWLAENGTSWDVVWTGDYRKETGAILDILRDGGAEVVADVDDWFEEVPSGNIARPYWFGEKKHLYRALMEESTRVSASTPFLADRYNGDVTPNFVDLGEWTGDRRTKKILKEVVICCPAGQGRAGDYAELREPLKAALELPNVKVLFMGVMPSWALDYPAGKVIWSRWAPLETYGKLLKWISPDIIVSPMLHNDFNLAKSNLKWLESGAVGACFMGERWGEYQRTVLDGVTGVLADGESDWTQKLLWLCTEHDERRKIAAEGAKEVAKNWTWDAVRPAWEQGVLGNGANDDRVACSTG